MNNSQKSVSMDGISGQNFLSALEEYTKRIDSAVAEIESQSETTLSRIFGLFIFIFLIATVLPLALRLSEQFTGSDIYRSFIQATALGALFAIIGLTVFTICTRILRLRRHRRNLETLLWPYQKLLQKLSQIVDHGDLDEGTSTLTQLKILEAEVAYSRGRRLVEGTSSIASLLFPKRIMRFEGWEVRQLAEEFGISIEEAERLLRRYWPDRDRARSAAAHVSGYPTHRAD